MRKERPYNNAGEEEGSEHDFRFRFKSATREAVAKAKWSPDKSKSTPRSQLRQHSSETGMPEAYRFDVAMRLERDASGEAPEDNVDVFSRTEGLVWKDILDRNRRTLDEVLD